ncbi:hypothetical protein R1sor_015193 [Riccia sorocarpa]|uniref:Uncharacterized protein n=1 Tax=Riccia sorocarpa TaxID=122646 RepID=A0ABD3HFF4_9MARC
MQIDEGSRGKEGQIANPLGFQAWRSFLAKVRSEGREGIDMEHEKGASSRASAEKAAAEDCPQQGRRQQEGPRHVGTIPVVQTPLPENSTSSSAAPGDGFEVVQSRRSSKGTSQLSGSQNDHVGTSNRFNALDNGEGEEEDPGAEIQTSPIVGEDSANICPDNLPAEEETLPTVVPSWDCRLIEAVRKEGVRDNVLACGEGHKEVLEHLKELASVEAAKLDGANKIAYERTEVDQTTTMVNSFPSTVAVLEPSEDHVSLGKEVAFSGEFEYQKWEGRGPKKKDRVLIIFELKLRPFQRP